MTAKTEAVPARFVGVMTQIRNIHEACEKQRLPKSSRRHVPRERKAKVGLDG